MGFCQIIVVLLQNIPQFGGAQGMTGIPGKTTFALVFFSMIVTIVVLYNVVHSRQGRAMISVREDEIAAEAMGINLAKHKMLSFCTSSFFAGIGGALLVMYQATVKASVFNSAMTYEILLIVVLGGIGSITGSCIGAFLYVACSEWWLRGLDSGKFLGISAPGIFRNGFRLVVFSVIIMCVVLFWRKGIMGDRELDVERLFGRKKKSGGGGPDLPKGEVSGNG